ncbi:MAG: response regulator transcription factor [Bacteroidota bacterium]
MKALICEDDEIMMKAISHKLSRDGIEIIEAIDGKMAIEKINEFEFDIIITDLMMPFLNGMEIINHVRQVKELKTPIVVLSKVGLENTVLDAFRLGADDYITKPFSPSELSIRIKRLLMKL